MHGLYGSTGPNNSTVLTTALFLPTRCFDPVQTPVPGKQRYHVGVGCFAAAVPPLSSYSIFSKGRAGDRGHLDNCRQELFSQQINFPTYSTVRLYFSEDVVVRRAPYWTTKCCLPSPRSRLNLSSEIVYRIPYTVLYTVVRCTSICQRYGVFFRLDSSTHPKLDGDAEKMTDDMRDVYCSKVFVAGVVRLPHCSAVQQIKRVVK